MRPLQLRLVRRQREQFCHAISVRTRVSARSSRWREFELCVCSVRLSSNRRLSTSTLPHSYADTAPLDPALIPVKCQLPKDGGTCNGYEPVYYFNIRNLRCEQLVYSGCGGNENRFPTQQNCNAVCTQQQGPTSAGLHPLHIYRN
jgi:hypothetical protein